MYFAKSLFIALAIALGSQAAFADQTDSLYPPYFPNPGNINETISGSYFTIAPGQTYSLPLNGWRQVNRIYVTSDNNGYPSTLQVLVNGVVKGTISIPSYNPTYYVTVREAASSVEFRNTGSNYITVTSVSAMYSNTFVPPLPIVPHPPIINPYPSYVLNQASYYAQRAITLVDALRYHADPAMEYVPFLLPIKTVAGRAYAAANGAGPLSLQVRKQFEALVAQIDYAAPCIQRLLQTDATFQLGSELLSLRETIARLLY